jgi:transposase
MRAFLRGSVGRTADGPLAPVGSRRQKRAFDGGINGMDARLVTASMCHSGDVCSPLTERASNMKVKAVGIDLSKNVFQVHCVDEQGKVPLRKQLKRSQMASFFANLSPCLIGMEACSGAHHWARKVQSFGHSVRLIAPRFVKPDLKSNKNDVADAETICEALLRPNMRFGGGEDDRSAGAVGAPPSPPRIR